MCNKVKEKRDFEVVLWKGFILPRKGGGEIPDPREGVTSGGSGNLADN